MSNGNYYVRNSACPCARCRTGGLMPAAILITLGLMFLVHQFAGYGFPRTLPVLLIVIGVVMLLARTASAEGHIQPYGMQGQAVAVQHDPWASGRMTAPPPPAPSSSGGSAPSGEPKQDDQQVNP
jgi:hypothetical protein